MRERMLREISHHASWLDDFELHAHLEFEAIPNFDLGQ